MNEAEAPAPLPKPTSGLELARLLQVDLDAGVIVAVFPDTIDEVVTQEVAVLDRKGNPMHIVLADVPGWGRRVIDLVSERNQPVRWWQVREAARIAGINEIPTRYEGPIGEIPDRYFTAGYVLGVRFYRHGPLFFPLEQPRIAAEDAVNDIIAEAVIGGGE